MSATQAAAGSTRSGDEAAAAAFKPPSGPALFVFRRRSQPKRGASSGAAWRAGRSSRASSRPRAAGSVSEQTPRSDRPAPGPDWPAIAAAYRAGASVAALARRYGVARSTIHRRAKREGWRRSPPPPPGRDGDALCARASGERRARSADRRNGAPGVDPGGASAAEPGGELAPLRALASRLREALEAMIEAGEANDFVLGARESPASLLLKLCQINEKIVAIERRLAGDRVSAPADLSADDRAILDRFKRRYGVD